MIELAEAAGEEDIAETLRQGRDGAAIDRATSAFADLQTEIAGGDSPLHSITVDWQKRRAEVVFNINKLLPMTIVELNTWIQGTTEGIEDMVPDWKVVTYVRTGDPADADRDVPRGEGA